MGCFDSKMDAKRKALADDWTGGEYAFAVGSVASLDEFCPLDKIAVKFCGGEGKERPGRGAEESRGGPARGPRAGVDRARAAAARPADSRRGRGARAPPAGPRRPARRRPRANYRARP